ncbi:hypothetical protein CPC08DRAFT_725631 [Agrocybe pediades]|nr:hypothetical protein CPC08DRAFT_725631 [Agrocybe pediades]
MVGYTIVDDRDPSIIYAPDVWMQGGKNPEFRGTTTYARTQGASLTFTFSGASDISVWGTITQVGDGVAPQSSYEIDKDNQNTFVYTAVQSNDTVQYNTNFFQSKALDPDREHTLTVTSLTNNASFYLDYFLLTPVDSGGAGATGVVVSPPSIVTSSSSVGSGAASSSTASPSAVTLSETQGVKTATALTIVGAVLSVLGFFSLLAAIFLFLKMRRERRRDQTNTTRRRFGKHHARTETQDSLVSEDVETAWNPTLPPPPNAPNVYMTQAGAMSSVNSLAQNSSANLLPSMVQQPQQHRPPLQERRSMFPPQYTKIQL